MPTNLLKVSDLTRRECEKIIDEGIEIKKNPEKYSKELKNRTLLMIFEKPSLRTRISFETGMTELGGHGIFYSTKESPLGRKENMHDTAKCASRYSDMIAARVHKKEQLIKLAEHSEVPVINLLDDNGHPCQILSDFQTIKEKLGTFEDIKLSYFGDAHNNVTYDLMRMSAILGIKMDVACPEGKEYSPEKHVLEEVADISETTDAEVKVVHDAEKAAEDSDVVYTDSWMSYGIPEEKEKERKEVFIPYQVNESIMEKAKNDAIFMNCLPAKRGYEQTAEVIDGSQSVVFDQAENRMHIQKAIMLFLLGKL